MPERDLVAAVLAAFPGAEVVADRRNGRPARPPGLHYEARISRDMLRREPATLWAFGDNLARAGLGGQAAEMRGEPNAVGIPTKHAPRRDPGAYFTDADLDAFRAAAGPAFARLRQHAEASGAIVWPVDGDRHGAGRAAGSGAAGMGGPRTGSAQA